MEGGNNQNSKQEATEHLHFQTNKKFFEEAAEKLDPSRKLTIDSGYDPMLHDMLKIEAGDYCGYFTIVRGKETKRGSESYSVAYNQHAINFKDECTRAYNKFKKKIERGI